MGGGSNENCMPNRKWLVGGADLQMELKNWLTNLINCYTNSLANLSSVALLYIVNNIYNLRKNKKIHFNPILQNDYK